MKTVKKVVPLMLLASSLMACGAPASSSSSSSSSKQESTSQPISVAPTSSSSSSEETYTITFYDGDEIVYQTTAHLGDEVDIPKLTSEDPRIKLTGWAGIDDDEFKAGKVFVYESDANYYAIWKEMFGTENKYGATKLRAGYSIKVDGDKDAAYDDCEKLEIKDLAFGNAGATADGYLAWDKNNLYAFFEVTDETPFPYQSGCNTNNRDSLNMFIDILHNDSLAEFGYTKGWGKPYRGEPGPMCEGWFKIGSGVSYPTGAGDRYGEGSEFCFDGWLSNAAKESGCKTVGTTKTTAKGYNVEYKIDLTNSNIIESTKPHVGQEIGVGIQIMDVQTEPADQKSDAVNRICLEALNNDMPTGPKKLSNVVLKANEHEDKLAITAAKVRDGFKVSAENEEDKVYKDAELVEFGDNTVKALWDDSGVTAIFKKGAETPSLKIRSTLLGADVEIGTLTKVKLPKACVLNDSIEFDLVYGEATAEETAKAIFVCGENINNTDPARKSFVASKVKETEEIAIDGTKDAAYDDAGEIDISYVSLKENGTVGATGKAYTKWDDANLYVFVDVKDDNVDSTTINESGPQLNDSVELWISTTESMPIKDAGWGDNNRPYQSYCGEGGFRGRALMATGSNLTGMHWMFDDKNKCPREAASVLTEGGYAVEFKIGWASFASATKLNKTIDFSICINDGENSARHGIVATNKDCHKCYLSPFYLDHLTLGE